jgi:hypothetical protein
VIKDFQHWADVWTDIGIISATMIGASAVRAGALPVLALPLAAAAAVMRGPVVAAVALQWQMLQQQGKGDKQ